MVKAVYELNEQQKKELASIFGEGAISKRRKELLYA
jgi:hypothetical protein